LRNGLDCYGDTLARVEILLRCNVERHQLERKAAARLDHRENHRSMTFDDTRAAKAIHDKRLMRSRLPVQFCEYRHQEQNGQDHHSCDDQYTLVHNVSFESSKSSQRRTKAIPLSYRVTMTSALFSIAVPSSVRADALRRTPA